MITHSPLHDTKWSDQNIIDLIRNIRNDLVKDFLDERFLMEYLSSHYRLNNVTSVRIELMKRSLKELLISPVRVEHYESLIQQVRETDSASLSERNEKLFYKEIDMIIGEFLYG